MIYIFIAQACSDLPVATCCRVMKVSTSGFYAWQANPVSDRDLDDAVLTNTIVDIHRMSRRSYGSPRVHAELRLGQDTRCSQKAGRAAHAPGRHLAASIAARAGAAPVGTRRPSRPTTWSIGPSIPLGRIVCG